MKKRCFSFILALCMICTLLPVSAIAAGASLDNFQKTLTYTPGQYADVPATNTFSENVKAAYEYNIMQGYGTTFGVTSNITRLASIIIACRLNCIYNTGVNNITELYTGTTQEIHLQYAKDHGIFCDFDDVSKSATRAEFATILSSALPDEALTSINSVEDNAIPDVDIDADHADDIYRLYRAGIINGSDKKGTFYPTSNITRGAACAIATRMADTALRKVFELKMPPKYATEVDSKYGRFVTYIKMNDELYSDGYGYYLDQYVVDGKSDFYITSSNINNILAMGCGNYRVEKNDNPYLAGTIIGNDFTPETINDKNIRDYGAYQHTEWLEYTGPSTAIHYEEWTCNGKTLTLSSDMPKQYEKNQVLNIDGLQCINDGSIMISVKSLLDYFGFSCKIEYDVYEEKADGWYNYPYVMTFTP